MSDGQGGSRPASVSIIITGATHNQAPVVTDESLSTSENGSVVGNLLANDLDPDGDSLVVLEVNGQSIHVGTPIDLPSGARLTVNSDGSYEYVTNGAFEGLNTGDVAGDSFSYTVSDGNGGNTPGSVAITVTGSTDNQAPTVTNETLNTSEDGSVVGNLLANDSDPDGDPLTVLEINGQSIHIGTPIALPSGAGLRVNSDGSYEYMTNGAFESLDDGETVGDSFSYTVGDGNGGNSPGVVSITITGVTNNQSPVVTDESLSASEDGSVVGNLLANDLDPDGDPLMVLEVNGQSINVGTLIDLPSGAQLMVNSDGSYEYLTNGVFEGLNAGDVAGDAFSYIVSDGKGGNTPGSASITITGVTDNQAPVVTDESISTNEDSSLIGNLLMNASDPDGDSLTVMEVNGQSINVGTLVELPSGTRLTVNSDGSYEYMTNGVFESLSDGETADDSFSYTVSDGKGGNTTGSVTITINGITDNQAPIVTNEALNTSEDGSLVGNLLANDSDPNGDTLSVLEVNGQAVNMEIPIDLPSGARLTVNSDGSYEYMTNGAFESLNDGETASDSFSYTVSDGNGGNASGVAAITINGISSITQPTHSGSSNPDELIGTDQSDILAGFQGVDTLTGLGGSDIFLYTSTIDGGDIITDFEIGQDKLDLIGVLEDLKYQGVTPVEDGHLSTEDTSQGLIIKVDPDGLTGGASPVSFILLQGVSQSSFDFNRDVLF